MSATVAKLRACHALEVTQNRNKFGSIRRIERNGVRSGMVLVSEVSIHIVSGTKDGIEKGRVTIVTR